MKILLINGSPNQSYGITSLFAQPFVNGLIDGGSQVETIYTSRLKINSCCGKLFCWKRENNTCFHKDDMDLILNKIKYSDLIIIATPVHSDGVTGPIKNLMDRLLPLKEPYFTDKNGRSRHISKLIEKKQLLLISTCGLFEIENFTPMLNHIRALCDNFDFQYAGSLLRPHSLLYKLSNNSEVLEIDKSLYQEGLNFMKYKFISHHNHMKILQNIATKEEYYLILNEYFEKNNKAKLSHYLV